MPLSMAISATTKLPLGPGRLAGVWSAGRRLPWRRIGIATLIAVVLLVAVPPLRRAVSLATSRAILWLASPATPFIPDFRNLPDTTRVLAADGSELATLAGKIRAPSALDPRSRPDAVIKRRDHVLRAMAKHHWLSKADLDAALAEPLNLAPPQPPGVTRAPHFVDYVKREVGRLEELG